MSVDLLLDLPGAPETWHSLPEDHPIDGELHPSIPTPASDFGLTDADAKKLAADPLSGVKIANGSKKTTDIEEISA